MYIDAHTHLNELSETERETYFERLAGQGIKKFVLGGIDPGEWQTQIEMKSRWGEKVVTCFGLHPWFVANSSREECEKAFKELEHLSRKSPVIGELGLDFHKNFSPDTFDRQREFFNRQLQLATAQNKPIVLHIVWAHTEALSILSKQRDLVGIVHGFSGSLAEASQYVEMGFKISIGRSIFNNKSLQSLVQALSLADLLVETDAVKDLQQPTIIEVAQKIAEIRGVRSEEILQSSSATARQVFLL